jgi:hypothetical protein
MMISYDITLSFELSYSLSLKYDNIKLVPLDHLCSWT